MSEVRGPSGRRRLLAGGLFLGAVLVAVWTLPLTEWLDLATAWIADNPRQGRVYFFLGYVAGTILMVPGSVLAMSGGYLFGVFAGLPIVSASIAVGALLACAAGRSFARDIVTDATAGNPRFAALDTALEKRGFVVVVLTRLSLLIPYNILNYAYGLTRIGYGTYFVATWIGMLPAAALYVYLGSVARDVEALVSGDVDAGWAGEVFFVAGLVAIVVATWVIHRTASRELKRQMGEEV